MVVVLALSLLLLGLAGAALTAHKEYLVFEDTVLDRGGNSAAATRQTSCELDQNKDECYPGQSSESRVGNNNIVSCTLIIN